MPKEEHMPRVVHFEIPAEKPERAVKFYESVFGVKNVVNTIGVASLDESIRMEPMPGSMPSRS
jgi:predicted enzyme related to lactoylglutathione lyase